MFLVTLRPCWGVSISDVGAAPLEKADEKDVIVEKFVSLFLFEHLRLFISKERHFAKSRNELQICHMDCMKC